MAKLKPTGESQYMRTSSVHGELSSLEFISSTTWFPIDIEMFGF